jgi:hypothetical protein
MTAHEKEGIPWRQTSVLIRADIAARTEEQGLNISQVCNQALADLVGIDYHQQQLPEEPPVKPVIIARDEKNTRDAPGTGPERPPLRPVLNADDPRAPAEVLAQKKDRPARHAERRGSDSSVQAQKKQKDLPEQSLPPASLPGSKKKTKPKPAKSGGQKNAIKRFVSTKVARSDAEVTGGVVPKDEMYQRFVRWCRVNDVSPVPDRRSFSVALKNRFVIQDTTVNDVPCWVNVVLK